MTKTSAMCFLLDALLPLSALIFWLPINPQLSTLPVLIWLVIQSLVAPSQRRWALWPILLVVLLGVRTWWFNPVPAPASLSDVVLFVSSLLVATSVAPSRWATLLKLSSIGLVPMLAFVGSKPWNPNPFVGVNQVAYLMGFAFIASVFWVFDSSQTLRSKAIGGFIGFSALVLVWQTGSRAALVASGVAILFVMAKILKKKYQSLRPILLIGCGLCLAYILRWQFFASGSNLPGLKEGSDAGRLAVVNCFAQVPFLGHNRLLYGAGFENLQDLCLVYFQGAQLMHSHNLFVQIWAACGVLGLFAIVCLFVLIVNGWRQNSANIDSFSRNVGQASLIYIFLQGVFDLSMLHWPVTLALTGIFLAIPLASWPSQESKLG